MLQKYKIVVRLVSGLLNSVREASQKTKKNKNKKKKQKKKKQTKKQKQTNCKSSQILVMKH